MEQPFRLALLFSLFFSPLFAQPTIYAADTPLDKSRLLGRTGVANRKQNAPVTVNWRDVPLREASVRLGGSQGLSVWFDRRVNPSQTITLEAQQMALGDIFTKAAEQGQAIALPVADFFYVGPADRAGELRTLLALGREQTMQLAADQQQAIEQRIRLRIPRLTEPQKLIEYLASKGKVRLEGLQQVPHDLWHEAQFPATATCDLLTFSLLGFDLTWRAEPDGQSIRIVPIERPVTIRYLHERSRIDRLASSVKQKLMIEQASDSQAWITGTVEQHEQLLGKTNRTATRPQQQPPRNTKQVYSLRIAEQPVGVIVQQLARQLGKQVEIDPAVTESMLSERVTFEVKDADLQQLLITACKPAGISVEVKGNTIRLRTQD